MKSCTVYVTWCNAPEDKCSYIGKQLTKRTTEAAARAALHHHLVKSPYHYKNPEEAWALVAEAPVEAREESWESDVEDAGGEPTDAAAIGAAPTKRRKRGPASSEGAASDALAGVPLAQTQRRKRGPDYVEMLDCARDAYDVATSCQQMASKAADAFGTQVLCLDSFIKDIEGDADGQEALPRQGVKRGGQGS